MGLLWEIKTYFENYASPINQRYLLQSYKVSKLEDDPIVQKLNMGGPLVVQLRPSGRIFLKPQLWQFLNLQAVNLHTPTVPLWSNLNQYFQFKLLVIFLIQVLLSLIDLIYMGLIYQVYVIHFPLLYLLHFDENSTTKTIYERYTTVKTAPFLALSVANRVLKKGTNLIPSRFLKYYANAKLKWCWFFFWPKYLSLYFDFQQYGNHILQMGYNIEI